MTTAREAVVRIGNAILMDGEVMTLRVALESFATSLQKKNALGNDKHGRTMRAGYLANIEALRELLVRASL